MTLSAQSLFPLQQSSVKLEYCRDRPLKYIATRYTATSGSCHKQGQSACTLLFAGGLSLSQETWIPVIRHLYRLTSEAGSRVTIHSAWVLERPNHGAAALLNEEILKEHYSGMFPSRQYATMIQNFLHSDVLSARERSNLIGIGHSGGGGSLILAFEGEVVNLPIQRLILVEAPLIGPECWGELQQLYKGVIRSNARRQKNWPSEEEAMKWIRTHAPWKTFHPDVLRIIAETYFRSDPEHPGRVTTKTTIEQETASFVDDGTHLKATPYLQSILHILPTHLINGSKKDLWTPRMYEQIENNLARGRHALASITTIEGAGHYIPIQMPEELAKEIAHILQVHADEGHVAKL